MESSKMNASTGEIIYLKQVPQSIAMGIEQVREVRNVVEVDRVCMD
jgi:hypothetical protein